MKTQCYVKYFEGEKEAIASDSVYTLDNRNRLAVKIEDAKKQAWMLRKVKPNYSSFEIRIGDYWDYWTQYTGKI